MHCSRVQVALSAYGMRRGITLFASAYLASKDTDIPSPELAESDKLPVILLGFVRSEVAGSAPHLVPGGNLACPSLEAREMRIDAALDAVTLHMS
ncbi:hypothetical protein NL676_000983 [Syzygium grande]|nr:hypothetical protein NL676_000983 [Syzygium grande]